MRQDPGKSSSWQIKAAVAALSVIALYNALIQFGVTDQFATQYPDPYQVMGLQARLRPVAERVPASERMGYFSDAPLSETYGMAAFLAAQHALAPRILLKEDAKTAGQARYWLGIFTKEENFAQKGQERRLVMEQDLGGYVVLYRKPEAAR